MSSSIQTQSSKIYSPSLAKNKLSTKPSSSSSARKSKQFTPWRMTLWGLNLIVGYSFLISIAPSYHNLGSLCLILLIAGGFVAGCSGFAFGKLATKFHHENGAIMQYSKKVLGRRASGFFGFFQLIQMILVSSTVAIGFLWAFGETKLPGSDHKLADQWYIIMICIIIFFIISAIPRFGFNTNKVTLIFIWIIKWFIIVGSILVAISLFKGAKFHDFISNHFTVSDSSGSHTKNLVSTFFQLFSGLFFFYFAFSGIEIVPSMVKDIQNRSKNIMRIVLFIVAGAFAFYLMYYVLIGSALGVVTNSASAASNPFGIPCGTVNGIGSSGKQFNPIISLFSLFFSKFNNLPNGALSGSIVGVIVLVLIVLAMFANKSAGRMQQGWANTRVVSSYARLGFLPKMLYVHKNKYGQYTYAFWFDFIFAGFFSILFLIFNLIASLTTHKYLNVGFQAPLELISMCAFAQYICAFMILLVLGLRYRMRKKLKNAHGCPRNYRDYYMKMSLKLLTFYGVMMFVFITLVDLWIGSIVYDLHTQFQLSTALTTQSITDITELLLLFGIIVGAFLAAQIGTRNHRRTKLRRKHNMIKQQLLNTNPGVVI